MKNSLFRHTVLQKIVPQTTLEKASKNNNKNADKKFKRLVNAEDGRRKCIIGKPLSDTSLLILSHYLLTSFTFAYKT